MRISVITPVYNGAKYIEETVVSVLKASETYDIEYLVIDDGSTDQTSQILEKYSTKISIIRQPNAGESAAVNTGFNQASGDFVLVVSADDPLFTPAIFNGVFEFFDNNPEVVVWYPDWNMIDQDGNLIRSVEVDEYSDEKLIGRFICLPGPGAFIRKSAALQIGGRGVKWKYVGDYDFWLRISRVGTLQKRNDVLAQWRYHDDSTSIAQRGKKMFNERIAVIDEFVTEFDLPNSLSRMARAHSHYFASILSFHSKDVNGKKALLRAFWIRRGWVEEAQIKIVIYLMLQPFSSYLKPILVKFLGKWIKARK